MKKIRLSKGQLLKKLAYLESVNDQLYTEVSYIDHLMQSVGFNEGLKTVKQAAEDIINNGYKEIYEI